MLDLIRVKTVYGDRLFVDRQQLETAKAKGRKLIKIYRKDGQELGFPGKHNLQTQLLHIDNIASGA